MKQCVFPIYFLWNYIQLPWSIKYFISGNSNEEPNHIEMASCRRQMDGVSEYGRWIVSCRNCAQLTNYDTNSKCKNERKTNLMPMVCHLIISKVCVQNFHSNKNLILQECSPFHSQSENECLSPPEILIQRWFNLTLQV